MVRPLFADRADAGRQLAARLREYAGTPELLVLALPRGGVPVAAEVARALGAELDLFLVRKLGLPGHEELALGAIAADGVRVLNLDVVRAYGIAEDVIARVAAEEQQELERRDRAYRGGRAAPAVEGRTVILVDDGLATGASMKAAVQALRALGPGRLVVAVPVAAEDTCREVSAAVDAIVCAATPEPFGAVGLWYEEFTQTSDEEVRALLRPASRGQDEGAPGTEPQAGRTAG